MGIKGGQAKLIPRLARALSKIRKNDICGMKKAFKKSRRAKIRLGTLKNV
jgi:hypothetical protein